MPDDAPIELYGFHDNFDVILARRQGEPSFVWVQDIGDAFQAAASRGVEIVMTRKFYDELVASGELPAAEFTSIRIL